MEIKNLVKSFWFEKKFIDILNKEKPKEQGDHQFRPERYVPYLHDFVFYSKTYTGNDSRKRQLKENLRLLWLVLHVVKSCQTLVTESNKSKQSKNNPGL